MTELTLELDRKASESLDHLILHYGAKNKAEIISKALTILSIAALIDQTEGELIARKDGRETRLVIN